MGAVYPLGHDGINESENIHCLNPNHHADFDYVRVTVDPELYRVSHAYREAVDGTELDIDTRSARNNSCITTGVLRTSEVGVEQYS